MYRLEAAGELRKGVVATSCRWGAFFLLSLASNRPLACFAYPKAAARRLRRLLFQTLRGTLTEDIPMRVLLILAAIVLLLAVAGWITFTSDAGRSSINVETDEIREDTGEMMRSGSELLRDAEQEITEEPAADGKTTPGSAD
jgi:hypothetical protein